jgi:hypothetical protein
VLHGGTLFYFVTDDDLEPKGLLELTADVVVRDENVSVCVLIRVMHDREGACAQEKAKKEQRTNCFSITVRECVCRECALNTCSLVRTLCEQVMIV